MKRHLLIISVLVCLSISIYQYSVVNADDNEVLSMREYNSKTYDLGGKFRTIITMSPLHYQDGAMWHDIDLSWNGYYIDNAPYDLVLYGGKIIIYDKASGKEYDLELIKLGDTPLSIQNNDWTFEYGKAYITDVVKGVDLIIRLENDSVSYSRVIKEKGIPFDATFNVSGNFTYRAYDQVGNINVSAICLNGALTENITAERDIQYPLIIDPTFETEHSYDDAWERTYSWSISDNDLDINSHPTATSICNVGIRFQNVTIPSGSVIDDAYLNVWGDDGARDNPLMDIYLEDADDPVDFNDYAEILLRDNTTATVEWDQVNIGTGWNVSPDLSSCVQEVVDRGGWISGNSMVALLEGRQCCYRYLEIKSHDYDPDYAPELVIDYTPPSTSDPSGLILEQTGLEQVTLNWNDLQYSDYQLIRGSYESQPSDNLSGYQVYAGSGNTTIINGLDLNSTPYYFSLWNVYDNVISSNYEIVDIGGGDMDVNVVLPPAIYALAFGCVMLVCALIFKKAVFYLAVIPCMVGVLIEPAFKDMWFQAGAVIIMLGSALGFFKKIMEGRDG